MYIQSMPLLAVRSGYSRLIPSSETYVSIYGFPVVFLKRGSLQICMVCGFDMLDM